MRKFNSDKALTTFETKLTKGVDKLVPNINSIVDIHTNLVALIKEEFKLLRDGLATSASTDAEPVAAPRRGRRAVVAEAAPVAARGRRAAAPAEPEPAPRRGRRAAEVEPTPAPRKASRAPVIEDVEEAPRTTRRTKAVDPEPIDGDTVRDSIVRKMRKAEPDMWAAFEAKYGDLMEAGDIVPVWSKEKDKFVARPVAAAPAAEVATAKPRAAKPVTVATVATVRKANATLESHMVIDKSVPKAHRAQYADLVSRYESEIIAGTKAVYFDEDKDKYVIRTVIKPTATVVKAPAKPVAAVPMRKAAAKPSYPKVNADGIDLDDLDDDVD